jgi:hypothetical protein
MSIYNVVDSLGQSWRQEEGLLYGFAQLAFYLPLPLLLGDDSVDPL